MQNHLSLRRPLTCYNHVITAAPNPTAAALQDTREPRATAPFPESLVTFACGPTDDVCDVGSGVGNSITVVVPLIVTVWPTVAVIEPLITYAGTVVGTPFTVVAIRVYIAVGAARTVVWPFMVTVWPIVAVSVPLMMYTGSVVATPLIVVVIAV